jgi:putative FmdB family regulatory protein
MPLYRYECSTCGARWTELAKIDDASPEHCGQGARKLMPSRVVGRCVPDSDGAHRGSGFAAASPRADITVAGKVSEAAGEGPVDGGNWEAELERRRNMPATEVRPETHIVAPEIDPDDPLTIPPPPTTGVWAKDFADCDAAQRDERWHDSSEALAAFTTKHLEDQGQAPATARAKAAEAAHTTIQRARAESRRADGPT